MAIFSELRQQVEVLDDLLGERADELADAMRGLSDEQLVAVVEAGARATRCLGRIEAVGAGIVAERSRREAGQQGLVQVRGHRNPAEFVQAITGTSKSDARQRIRVGQSVLDAVAPSPAAADGLSRRIRLRPRRMMLLRRPRGMRRSPTR